MTRLRTLTSGLCSAAALCALSLPACTDADETGATQFQAWGEEFIEAGIPDSEFADGWSVHFDRFLIVLGDVRADNTDGSDEVRLPGGQLFDLVQPGPQLMGIVQAQTGDYEGVGFLQAPADANTYAATATSAEDLALMRDNAYAVYVEGAATKGERTVTFQWGFGSTVSYTDCVTLYNDAEVPGFPIQVGATTPNELTIHGDHLFYDDLSAEDAVLRFDPIAAADANADGEVTLDELSDVALLDIAEGSYGTGNFSDVDDLGAFVARLVTTLGHFNGEGHCQSTQL